MKLISRYDKSYRKISIVAGFSILFFYYIFIFFRLEIPSNTGFYLSFALPTDIRYSTLMLGFKNYFLDPKISFPWSQLYLDRYIIELLGYNFLWVIVPLYKFINFLILYCGYIYISSSKKSLPILISLVLAIFLSSDFQSFIDRYPRPLNTNIPFSVIFIFNIILLENKPIGKLFLFIFGASYGVIFFSNPWAFCFLLPMTLLILKNKILKVVDIYTILGFLIFFTPQFISVLTTILEGSFHSEYLGLKNIEKPTLFLFDYYASFFNFRALLFIFLLSITALILGSLKTLKILLFTCLVAPLPFIIIGKTIQSYHFVITAKDLMFYFLLHDTISLIKKRKLILLGMKIKRFDFLIITFLVCFAVLNLSMRNNSWIDRTQRIYKEYTEIFSQLDSFSIDCVLVTNDPYLQSYWSGVKGASYLPKDGFFRSMPLASALEETTRPSAHHSAA